MEKPMQYIATRKVLIEKSPIEVIINDYSKKLVITVRKCIDKEDFLSGLRKNANHMKFGHINPLDYYMIIRGLMEHDGQPVHKSRCTIIKRNNA